MKIIRFLDISIGWCLSPVLLLLLSAVAWAEEPRGERPVSDTSKCEFVVKGNEVERIILVPAQWTPSYEVKDLNIQPGVSVFLPPGNYTIQYIYLRGGYQSGPRDEILTLIPNATNRLAVGTPLKSTVSVNRQGRMLNLNYQLLDDQGRKYTNPNRSDPPRFVVYQGQREIGSGTFEYG
jgi:hypothetical protein